MERRLMRPDAEVIVVGGGPAGAATAAQIAARGRDVLLLEKAGFPRDKACAEFLSPGAVAALDRLGVLPALQAARPAWLDGMRIVTERGGFLLAYAAPGGHRALGIPRAALDQVLLDHARARGARVRERTRVLAPIVEGGRVVGVQTRDGTGQRALRAGCVVVADGLRSTLTRALGLDRPATWPRRLGLVARFAGVEGVERDGQMHVGAGLYCGLAPVGQGVVNVGLVGPLAAGPAGQAIAPFYERRLRRLPGVARALAHAERVTPVRGAGPLARRVHRLAGRGYLLVGDAAGFLDPFTGEGIYRALRGAELAASAVERALQRPDAYPVGYERARRAAFAAKEGVCLLVQGFLSSRPTFDYVVGHLAARPPLAATLAGVLGDYRPAHDALRPAYLAALLAPNRPRWP
jgi:geranylgeranyl reductase family protein